MRAARAGLAAAVLAGLAAALASTAVRAVPGTTTPIPLPTGRALTPAGTMVGGGDFPAGAVLRGGTLFVATAGETENLALGVDSGTLATTSVMPLGPPSPSGAPYAQTGALALSPDGSTLYSAGGRLGVVHSFRVVGTALVPTGYLSVPGFAGGVAVTADGTALVVTIPFDSAARNGKGTTVARLPVTGGGPKVVTVGHHPLAVADGTTASNREVVAVANRDDGTVSILDAATLAPVASVATGRQPAALRFTADGAHLLVVDSLDDELADVDTVSWSVTQRLAVGAGVLLGAAPSDVDVSPDGARAAVALSADNAVALLDRVAGRWTVSGRVPTAWYPTSVRWDAAGQRLLVTAGKGVGGPNGSTPPGLPVLATSVYNPGSSGIGVAGVVESIPLPDPATLAGDTALVLANNMPASGVDAASAALPCPGGLDAIRHVVFVIRENKTYDQELGDEPGGAIANVMYPRAVTPNTHALAERNALLESFYADAEVSDTGHQALLGGTPNDWVERFTQQSYGLDGAPRPGAELGNDDSVLWPPANYLLDNALAHGLEFRDYGELYRRDQVTDGPVSPELGAHIVTGFPHFGFAPDYPDTGRIAYWRTQFAADVANGTFPQLEVIYLPEDHTTTTLSPLPQQQVADSDLATGQLVDSISHSPYWESTAVFLTEDDPQSGVDSVDEHRTVGLVVGPHVRDGVATARRYDQGSMLRTMEEILHLPPLTEFDAAATPMDALFSSAADVTPFTAITPSVPFPTAATVAAARALVADRLGTAPSADDPAVPPATQRDVQWLLTHGAPYAPTGAVASPSLERAAAPSTCGVYGGTAGPTPGGGQPGGGGGQPASGSPGGTGAATGLPNTAPVGGVPAGLALAAVAAGAGVARRRWRRGGPPAR